VWNNPGALAPRPRREIVDTERVHDHRFAARKGQSVKGQSLAVSDYVRWPPDGHGTQRIVHRQSDIPGHREIGRQDRRAATRDVEQHYRVARNRQHAQHQLELTRSGAATTRAPQEAARGLEDERCAGGAALHHPVAAPPVTADALWRSLDHALPVAVAQGGYAAQRDSARWTGRLVGHPDARHLLGGAGAGNERDATKQDEHCRRIPRG
jgi:hypothetical protein